METNPDCERVVVQTTNSRYIFTFDDLDGWTVSRLSERPLASTTDRLFDEPIDALPDIYIGRSMRFRVAGGVLTTTAVMAVSE